jgi:hypothetical protein
MKKLGSQIPFPALFSLLLNDIIEKSALSSKYTGKTLRAFFEDPAFYFRNTLIKAEDFLRKPRAFYGLSNTFELEPKMPFI